MFLFCKQLKYMEKEKVIEYLALFIAWIEMLFFSGIIFGINSLFPVLKKEGLFLEFCNTTNATEACSEQNKMFGFILITTVAVQSLIAFPIGIFFDKFLQRWTKIVAGLSFLFGCLFFFFFKKSSLLVYPFAACLAVSTQCLLNCNLSLASLFPSYQNRIVSVLSGSIDTSTIVFTLVSLTYFAGLSLFTSVLVIGFSGFALMMLSAVFLLGLVDSKTTAATKLPEKTVTVSENGYLASDHVLPENDSDDSNLEFQDSSSIDNEQRYCKELHDIMARKYPTLLTALLSRQYLIQLFFFTIIFFRFSFILAQLSLQMEHHFPSQENNVNGLLSVSGYFFACGLLVSPFAGLIVDHFKGRLINGYVTSRLSTYQATLKCFVLPQIVCCLSNILMAVFIMVPRHWAMYLTYALLTLTRAFLFSLNSSYILQSFPQKFFGKLLGGALLFAGIVSFLQFALLSKNPQHMRNTNIVLIAVSFLPFVHPVLLCFGGRKRNGANSS